MTLAPARCAHCRAERTSEAPTPTEAPKTTTPPPPETTAAPTTTTTLAGIAERIGKSVRETAFGPISGRFTGALAWRGLVPIERLKPHHRAPQRTQRDRIDNAAGDRPTRPLLLLRPTRGRHRQQQPPGQIVVVIVVLVRACSHNIWCLALSGVRIK